MIHIQFKDPDAIWEIVETKFPYPENEDEITPKMEKERSDFMKKYFEFGDYGVIGIDPKTLECKLIEKKKW